MLLVLSVKHCEVGVAMFGLCNRCEQQEQDAPAGVNWSKRTLVSTKPE